MKSLHQFRVLVLQDKHSKELEELRKKQRKEMEDLVANLELVK